MSNKNAIVILTHNLYFTETVLKNMPKQKGIDIIFVNDVRVKNCITGLNKLIYKYNLQRNARIFSSIVINRYIKSVLELTEDGISYLEMYTMGMNINAQYYILAHPRSPYKKAIFLDEDVLINKDLSEIFEKEEFSFLGSIMNTGHIYCSDERSVAWKDFAKCECKTWVDSYINGGQRIYTGTDKFKRMYKKLLEEFYNNEVFYACFKRWKETGKNKSYAFFQDQNFETSFIIRSGLGNYNMKEYCRYVCGFGLLKHKEKYIEKHLLHFALCVDVNKKIDFIKMLQKEKIIKR